MKSLAFAALAAALLTGTAQATTFQFFFFGGEEDFGLVGDGSFSTDTVLGAGIYDYGSLINPQFNFTIQGLNFTNANLLTPTDGIFFGISEGGGSLSVNFDSDLDGPFGGSLDFAGEGGILSFESGFGPRFIVAPDGESPPAFGFYVGFTPPPAVPEPASWAMLIAGFGLIGAMARLRRLQTI